MPYQLVPEAGPSKAVRLDKAVILFGRHPDCDIVITSSRKVSRKHCCLAQVNNTFIVRDLGSMNGVRVNGHLVKRSAKVRLGDQLTVGDVVFHLKEDSANGKAPRKAPPPDRPTKPVPRHMISQDIPVVIPDEDQSFAVEASLVKSPTDSDIPVDQSGEHAAEDDSEWEIDVIG